MTLSLSYWGCLFLVDGRKRLKIVFEWLVNNYWPKWGWIVVDVCRSLTTFTNTEVNYWFSSYHAETKYLSVNILKMVGNLILNEQFCRSEIVLSVHFWASQSAREKHYSLVWYILFLLCVDLFEKFCFLLPSS